MIFTICIGIVSEPVNGVQEIISPHWYRVEAENYLDASMKAQEADTKQYLRARFGKEREVVELYDDNDPLYDDNDPNWTKKYGTNW